MPTGTAKRHHRRAMRSSVIGVRLLVSRPDLRAQPPPRRPPTASSDPRPGALPPPRLGVTVFLRRQLVPEERGFHVIKGVRPIRTKILLRSRDHLQVTRRPERQRRSWPVACPEPLGQLERAA